MCNSGWGGGLPHYIKRYNKNMKNNLKVFCDFHHASLLYSFILLFEKRLGGFVYRPIGMEWAERGYWKVYDHPATQLQFLTADQGYRPVDGTPPLNQIKDIQEGVYYCQDIDSGYYNKAITFDKFMELDIDIVIASIPQHVEPFKRLCALHPNRPKLIFQIGNSWTVDAGLAPNIMASAIINNVPENINFISYHQEFDLNLFKPQRLDDRRRISSFVNCFDSAEHFKDDWQLFLKVERALPNWDFYALGGQCRDGAAHGSDGLAKAINSSRFIWHTKNAGDGYGHIIHNAAACGRPLIVKKQYYIGKLAEPLINDETSVIIDGLNPQQIKDRIEAANEDDVHEKMSFAMYDKFKQVVNFDVEEIQLREFLEKLV